MRARAVGGGERGCSQAVSSSQADWAGKVAVRLCDSCFPACAALQNRLRPGLRDVLTSLGCFSRDCVTVVERGGTAGKRGRPSGGGSFRVWVILLERSVDVCVCVFCSVACVFDLLRFSSLLCLKG